MYDNGCVLYLCVLNLYICDNSCVLDLCVLQQLGLRFVCMITLVSYVCVYDNSCVLNFVCMTIVVSQICVNENSYVLDLFV